MPGLSWVWFVLLECVIWSNGGVESWILVPPGDPGDPGDPASWATTIPSHAAVLHCGPTIIYGAIETTKGITFTYQAYKCPLRENGPYLYVSRYKDGVWAAR